MKLHEALATGLPIKNTRLGNYCFWTPDKYSTFNLEGVTADDWEVQEKSVTITRSQLSMAIHSAITKYAAKRNERITFNGEVALAEHLLCTSIVADIAKELGL